MDLTYDKQVELNKISDNYKVIEPFVAKYKRLSYMQFDYAVVHELTLFTTEPDFSFEALEGKIDVILSALPSIKRIFAQPFIHLKQQDVILPTESVRIINNDTIRHIASHSELWTDVNEREIKPAKLLTRTYEDNYGIYENLVFCKTVDDILAFTRANVRFIKELIYTNQTIEINLLERVNHLNYFLALGKLHTGYSRNFDSYYAESLRCLNKLQFIDSSIVPRLKRPVYKNNKSRPSQIKLRKTNILSMHKEYHQVYKLAKYFAANNVTSESVALPDIEALQRDYFNFCELLCLFSVGHFNFTCDENKQMELLRLNTEFAFKDWRLTLKREKVNNTPCLSLSVKKDVTYRAVIVPSVAYGNDELLETVKENCSADEYVVFTPFEDAENAVLIDITSVESFRRIQQIILRCMVYSDTKRDECPFCKNKLVKNEEKSIPDSPVYECASCRTVIGQSQCAGTGKTYFYTGIEGLRKTYRGGDDLWLEKRKLEAQMFFRNITPINDDMEIVCPHCGKAHK